VGENPAQPQGHQASYSTLAVILALAHGYSSRERQSAQRDNTPKRRFDWALAVAALIIGVLWRYYTISNSSNEPNTAGLCVQGIFYRKY
jgi:hypothetical protein